MSEIWCKYELDTEQDVSSIPQIVTDMIVQTIHFKYMNLSRIQVVPRVCALMSDHIWSTMLASAVKPDLLQGNT